MTRPMILIALALGLTLVACANEETDPCERYVAAQLACGAALNAAVPQQSQVDATTTQCQAQYEKLSSDEQSWFSSFARCFASSSCQSSTAAIEGYLNCRAWLVDPKVRAER